ncbi:uncharacterized protein A1O9_01464 [Exophiala aquamarina CBS 119918]|uniref:F-box domain-containing protein n=1 Tax=Exophiala aquamarina CBS 119918 TaxID=1182545 RepID=A0A072PUF1_9EURO|nr:uncharacterized protein A1O9_01464 [Exophiala aquamarina CBS 119918]KEF63486.1 hypothetical protein A1O9_01464 [Exophiala aquamarina CBS 119918]
MEDFPDEVLLKICRHLNFTDVSNLRCVTSRFAPIGAEVLIKRVRFHVSQVSLERLDAIASHQVLSKAVDTVFFEGNILANVGCIHAFSRHFEADHHNIDRPKTPGADATDREVRLYERNRQKFQQEISTKYERYRKLYDAQQTILNSGTYATLIAGSISQFPKLRKVVLSTVGRCKHVLSERFMTMFAVDCALPLEPDTCHTKEQLKALLVPQDQPLTVIRELEVHVLSPKFFTGFLPSHTICQVFANLKVINLNFRLERDDRNELDIMTAENCYGSFANGHLRDALKAASGLQKLTINFDDFGYFGPCTHLKHVLGESVWPDLDLLDLDCMSTTQEYLIDTLKRQPVLTKLTLGFFTLEDGRWTTATDMMRKELRLNLFVAHGVLEDSERMHPMHLIDTDAYMEDFAEFSLTNALDMYVTDHDLEEEDYHPLDDENFTDPDELREDFGPYMDSDEAFDEMDCSE